MKRVMYHIGVGAACGLLLLAMLGVAGVVVGGPALVLPNAVGFIGRMFGGGFLLLALTQFFFLPRTGREGLLEATQERALPQANDYPTKTKGWRFKINLFVRHSVLMKPVRWLALRYVKGLPWPLRRLMLAARRYPDITFIVAVGLIVGGLMLTGVVSKESPAGICLIMFGGVAVEYAIFRPTRQKEVVPNES